MEKGEIARNEQFLLLPQYFQNNCTADTQKPGLVWERVKLENYCLEEITDRAADQTDRNQNRSRFVIFLRVKIPFCSLIHSIRRLNGSYRYIIL